MSYCTFIASNLPLPEIKRNEAYITVREAIARNIEPHEFMPWEEMDLDAKILIIESEEELEKLTITEGTYYDVSDYTEQPHIYDVSFRYTAERVKQLLHYIQTNQQDGQVIELQQIWLDEYDVPTKTIDANDLTYEQLARLYDDEHPEHDSVYCLVIQK